MADDIKVTSTVLEVAVAHASETRVTGALAEVAVAHASETRITSALAEVAVASWPDNTAINSVMLEVAVSPNLVLLTSISPDTVGSDGGVVITATGEFPSEDNYRFSLISGATEIDAFSGVVGQGTTVVSADGLTASFVCPELAPGTYDLKATGVNLGATFTLAAALTVVKKSGTTNVYALRAAHARPRYVGPYSILDES